MQTDIKMQEYDGEERRALNMIWTAAKDHSSGRNSWLLTGTEGQTFISTVLSVMSTDDMTAGKCRKCSGHFRARRSRISMIPYSGLAWSAAPMRRSGKGGLVGGAAQGILGPGIGGIQMVGSGKAGPVPSDGLGQDGSGREARGDALGAGDFVRPVL